LIDPHRTTSPGSNDPGDSLSGETPLAGGVSSDISIVHAPSGDYVVKRALPKLRVNTDWFSDPARSAIEVNALRAMSSLLGPSHLPRVLWSDESSHRFAMELIDARFKNWKQLLLSGVVDNETARAAGKLLAQLHARSAGDATLASQFADNRTFIELRIQPFFERVAQKNSELRSVVNRIVESIHASRCALVHGDYSPKNLLVDGNDVVILDCEVAHWGDPRFDIAFCVAHLLLKSFRREASGMRLRSAAREFLMAYRHVGLPVVDDRLAQQLGCLLLARLEGDSPVDYLDDLDVPAVKAFGKQLIERPPSRFDIEAVR
jgi:5-methylthioribose kinase